MKKITGKSNRNYGPSKVQEKTSQITSKNSNPSSIQVNLPSIVSFKNALDQTYLKVN